MFPKENDIVVCHWTAVVDLEQINIIKASSKLSELCKKLHYKYVKVIYSLLLCSCWYFHVYHLKAPLSGINTLFNKHSSNSCFKWTTLLLPLKIFCKQVFLSCCRSNPFELHRLVYHWFSFLISLKVTVRAESGSSREANFCSCCLPTQGLNGDEKESLY